MKYLRFDSLESCDDPIKKFYRKFFLGRPGYYEGANIQISANRDMLLIKKINSNGTGLDFEDYEIAHCTKFWIKNGKIVVSKYADLIGGKTEDWGMGDKRADEMIEYIKSHNLLPDYLPT